MLTGGRVTAEDAYAYSKFARVALGTNDVDFRSRPLSAEEASFLAAEIVLRSTVTYADLETASTVVLAGLEPEEEAGTIFLRLRKASMQGTTRVVSIAPYATRGLRKMSGHLIQTAPGDEAAAIEALVEQGEYGVDSTAVILVGERLATVPGALSAAAALAAKTGARLAWVPRRAGDRGAVETGCLPNLLPGGRPVADPAARVDAATAWGVDSLPEAPGRDADQIVSALGSGELGGLVIGGVDPDDTADPAATRAAIAAASFVVALEIRETEVTRLADVVFPVAPVIDKAGMFVTWEGRPRPFDAVFSSPTSLPDLRILAGIAEELASLGQGARSASGPSPRRVRRWRRWAPGTASAPRLGGFEARSLATSTTERRFALATWKLLVDNGAMQDGDKAYRATGRAPVVKLSRAAYAALGETVTLTGDRGSVTLPAEPADLDDGVVWVPANSFGNGVLADLASPGSRVSVKGAEHRDREPCRWRPTTCPPSVTTRGGSS